MICQLHIFIHKTEYNARNTINYYTIIRQDIDAVCAENYCMKIIMDIISYFTCTIFGKYFVYCGLNIRVY